MAPRTIAIFTGVWLLVLGTLVVKDWLGQGTDQSEPEATPSVELSVNAPAEVDAGESFGVVVDIRSAATETAGAIDAEGSAAILVIDGGYGFRRLETTVADGQAVFVVPPAPGPESGTVLLEAVVGKAVASTTAEIRPGPAGDPTAVFLGPRTIVADQRDHTMAVAVAEDRFGNPVADGTAIDFRTTRPSGDTESQSTSTEGLIAFAEVQSGTQAGRSRVGVEIGDVGAPERTFLEVAGVPVPFSLVVGETIPPADGNALLEMKTTVLADRFGNVVPDGTAVVLDGRGSTGNRRITGSTIEGVAHFVVEAPDRPGPAEFTALASGTPSDPTVVDFEPAVTAIPVEVVDHEEGFEVLIGRVASTRSAYVLSLIHI